MPLNTDPNAQSDADYEAGMKAWAEAHPDDLHHVPDEALAQAEDAHVIREPEES